MTPLTRRGFLSSTVAGLGALALNGPALAQTGQLAAHASSHHEIDGYHGPIGIQLYTLGGAVQKDMAAAFAMLAKFGYREIEALQYTDINPVTMRQQAAQAGLLLRSSHLNFGETDEIDSLLDIGKQLGVTQVGSSVLPPRAQDVTSFIANANALTVADFQRMAERANRIGERARRAGLRYFYHNHNLEFRDLGRGLVGYDILLRETEPALVQFEADCGWMKAAGADPIRYFQDDPTRFCGIHVKNFDVVNFSTTPDATSQAHITALGSGVINYPPILRAALQAGVSYVFIEHDPRYGVPITPDQVAQEFNDLSGWLDAVRFDPSRPRR